MASLFSDQVLEDFTVDELIGVVKWLELTTSSDLSVIAGELDEYKDMEMGEVPVSSCRETVRW